MATNMLDQLRALVTPQLLGALSSRLGESESAVSKGLSAACPLILSALMQKTSEPNALSQIMSLLTNRANNPDVLANPRSILTGEASSSGVTELASNLLSTVFGRHAGSATNALSDYAGIKSASASSIMTLAGSLVTAYLGDRVRRDGLSGAGLASLLNGHRDTILNTLPGSLASLAGIDTVRDTVRDSVRDTGYRTTAAVRDVRTPQRGLGWLWPAAAALVLALGGWALWNNRQATRVAAPARDVVREADQAARRSGQVAGDAAQSMSDPVRDWQIAVAKLGPMTSRRLPSNIELSFPQRGVETEIIAYLDDPSKQVDPVVWFNFDRLLFETGSASLKAQSQEQIRNMAEIMKAYPTVKVRIGGYTDNTGDPAGNLKLSQDRARNVMNAIVALGVPADRVSAEGYGEQFPVADNSTPEGRQQNRRIAMRVTEK